MAGKKLPDNYIPRTTTFPPGLIRKAEAQCLREFPILDFSDLVRKALALYVGYDPSVDEPQEDDTP